MKCERVGFETAGVDVALLVSAWIEILVTLGVK